MDSTATPHDTSTYGDFDWPPHPARHPTWTKLVRAEPRLAALENTIRTMPRPANYWPAWSGIKRRFSRLVGWSAEHPDLQNSASYDVAYRHLYDLYDARFAR